jgi:two-component system, sensor histidine kinase and response regulator
LLAVLGYPEAGPARARRAKAAAPAVPTYEGRRVLVAEDDPTSQKVIGRMLERRGIRTDVVADGRAAVEACLRRRYDLVWMDCRLAGLDGFAATREIRRREPAEHHVPIVALSASTGPDMRQRCLDAGMQDHVGKPIRNADLDAILKRWLTAAPTAAAVPALPVLDTEALLDRVEGDLEFVRDLADGLLRDAPQWLASLRAAIAEGDERALEHAAHAVRGSVGNLGGTAACALAAGLEARARTGDLTGGDLTCVELEAELERLHHALLALGDDDARVGRSAG